MMPDNQRQTMGLMEQLAALAIRKKVSAELREHCPAELKGGLEELLSDDAFVSSVQNLLSAGRKNPAALTPDYMKSQLMESAAAVILQKFPGLTEYLVQTATALLKR